MAWQGLIRIDVANSPIRNVVEECWFDRGVARIMAVSDDFYAGLWPSISMAI